MIRTYKRKLILTKTQEQRLRSWIGACRTVYNLALEVKNHAYQVSQKGVSRFELVRQIKGLREDIPWIEDVPFETLNDSLIRLDLAHQRFFKTYTSGGGHPKFASKKNYKSISFCRSIRIINNKINIPKIGRIKIYKDSLILGTVKRIVIKIEPTGFFAYLQCDNVPLKFNGDNQAIGLDMGLSNFCIDSNGGIIANPKHFKKYERKLRVENRSLARKKKGSNSWKKQAKKLSLLHYRIASVRRDFLHKESTKIAKSNNVVYMENLNIAGMSKNPSLSKHILDAGWGEFRTMLAYKTKVVAINPAYTSQTCFECGIIDAASRISQSKFICTSCGHENHADINAAKNIMRKGIALDRKREALACA